MKAETKQWWIQWGKNLWSTRIYLFGVPGGIIGFQTLLFLKHRYAHSLYVGLFSVFGVSNARMIIGVFVLVAGIGASVFKHRNQIWYGLVEFIFGSGSGFAVAYSMSPERAFSPQWVTLVGCAYVIARGLNNIIDGGAKQDALRKNVSA